MVIFGHLGPEPLGLLGDQLGQVSVLRVEEGVEGRLVVSGLPGNPSALEPALPDQLLTHRSGQKMTSFK